MGWTSLHREPGSQTDREFFEAELCAGDTIVACATVKNVFYAAVHSGPESSNEPGITWALVALIQRTRGEYNFTYKTLTDTMGPSDCEAPAKVLDALTPTDNVVANEWRAECRATIALKAKAKAVKPGTVVRFARPLVFTNGDSADTFTFEGRSSFRIPFGGRYRITSWRTKQWEIVG